MKALWDTLEPGSADWALAEALDPQRIPAHIAIIMDGNGRWANRRSLPRVAGHRAGVEPVRQSVETCARLGVQVLTLYAFSVENWKRPRTEVDTLWRLLRYYLKEEFQTLQDNNVRFRAIGRMEPLSPTVRRELKETIDATRDNTGLVLNLAINYGGRTEIIDAVNAALEEARRHGKFKTGLHLNEESVARHLYTAGQPDPDLLIRTSGEMRISNFLLWQIAYAELYVTDTYWPDFNRTKLLEAILEYQKRERRFGGIQPSESPAEPCSEPVGVISR